MLQSCMWFGLGLLAVAAMPGDRVSADEPRLPAPAEPRPVTPAGSAIPSRMEARTAPILQVTQWRKLFYGYDTLRFRLAQTGTTLRLAVAADYGDRDRRYYSVRFPDGSDRPLTDYHHQKMRCQMFNHMTWACVIRDTFNVELSPAELTAYRESGLQLRLRSKTADLETLALPGTYFRDFLGLVRVQP